jgi:predicted MFS family arabinose efflux permease
MESEQLGEMVKAGTVKESSVTVKVFNDGVWTTVTYLMVITVVLIFVVQFFFGVGFGCLPNVLHQNYGLHQLSTVHGLVLSAWGCAGLVGNQLSGYIIRNYTLTTLYITLAILYTIMCAILLIWTRVIKAGKKFA